MSKFEKWREEYLEAAEQTGMDVPHIRACYAHIDALEAKVEAMEAALENIMRHADRPSVQPMEACRYCQLVAEKALSACRAANLGRGSCEPMR